VTHQAAADPPAGYSKARVGGAEIVALADVLPRIREALRAGTLHGYAARHPAARAMHGRATAYAAPLPGNGMWVVVRHSRHGGLLAPLTGDRFLAPTRAPRELAITLRLAELSIATPPMVAYVLYPAGPMLARSDVATREIAGGADLAALLSGAAHTASPDTAIGAAGVLLARLARAGVHHPDLNLKNILIAPDGWGALSGYLLDVDRVEFASPDRAARANAARLTRSARKWRDRHHVPIRDVDIARLEAAALGGSE
jgi:3-deoxy-D-manno-octulosonic acid kinase